MGQDELRDVLTPLGPAPWKLLTDAYPAEYIEVQDADGNEVFGWHSIDGMHPTFDEYVEAARAIVHMRNYLHEAGE